MTISLIIPVFNEEQAIDLFYQAVKNETALQGYPIEMVFINDGSTDNTESVLDRLAQHDPDVVVIHFSRNFGKEPALFAGLDYASGDAVIPIDVDLQDPIDIVPLLIQEWEKGAEVVLAKRVDRSADGSFKRISASLFYRFHNKIADITLEENVGDFRLMSRKVVETIKQLPENKLFMKGIFAWVGFTPTIIEYTRPERLAGNSKFNIWKLWNLALEGITSFSTLPLRLWSYIGSTIAFFSLIYAGYMVIDKLMFGNSVPGYPSLITAILFLGGVQLIGIGILGEYIGRIYMESKHRPRYIVKRTNAVGRNNKTDN